MTHKRALAVTGVAAIVSIAAAPASQPPPIATYWMDVATQSGMGAGMTAGSRPNASQIMGMVNGGGRAAVHTLDLRLASRQKPAAPAQADHLIPTLLQMGASLPLITPAVIKEERVETGMPTDFERPKGRMLIYWGCGEHVSAGQPTVIDFARLAAGQMPAGMAAMASMAHVVSGPSTAPGFGRWPNVRDSRPVPASGSLVGAHRVQSNYAPAIGFDLSQGQDFMPALGLREAGALQSGASRLLWQPAAQATGYALSMFGSNEAGDVIMWGSANRASMPAMDYLAPAEVRRLVAAGAVLPPGTSQCILPAEVAAASPFGMVTMIGYGPEANFAEAPKAPKWTTKVRFKSTASVIRGMGAMMGDEDAQQPSPARQTPPPPRRRGIGLGGILGGVIPIPH